MQTFILVLMEILNISLLIFLSVVSYRIYQKMKKINFIQIQSKFDSATSIINNIDLKQIEKTIIQKINEEIKNKSKNMPVTVDEMFENFDGREVSNKVTRAIKKIR